MDQDVIELARQLQLRLQRIDPRADRATFEWAHGFLITLVEQIEKSIPALTLKRSSSESDLLIQLYRQSTSDTARHDHVLPISRWWQRGNLTGRIVLPVKRTRKSASVSEEIVMCLHIRSISKAYLLLERLRLAVKSAKAQTYSHQSFEPHVQASSQNV